MFCWQLPPGDYVLIGVPADDASAPEIAQHHWPLAALRVAPGPEISCAGDLVVDATDSTTVLRGPPRIDFGIGGINVTNACAARTREIESIFAPLGQTPPTRLMVDISDLGFEDPGLATAVRARLDAGAGAADQ